MTKLQEISAMKNKKITVKFYTENGKYKGWKYLNDEVYHNEIKNWIDSKNYIIIEKTVFNWINKSKLFFGIYRNYIK